MAQETLSMDIVPDESLGRFPDFISIPRPVREDLGVVVGQRLQFRVPNKVLMLQVISEAREGPARVSPKIFRDISLGSMECTAPPITLGCDPEFFILWGRRVMSASTYLPYYGQVGCDGGLGELRPTHGVHENQVVGNLLNLVEQIPRKVVRQPWAKGFPRDGKDLLFEAHSFYEGLSAGFHVHLGLPPELLNTKPEIHKRALNHLVRCLDWYVSTLLVAPEPSDHRRCGHSNYGLPGDYRLSNVTLEYRTPGGFYLRSPALAEGLLGLSLLVAESFVDRLRQASDNFVKLGRLTDADLQQLLRIPRPELIRFTLMEKRKEMARRASPQILSALKDLPNYPRHQGSVERFDKEVGKDSLPSPNLITNWRK